ncbi:uncharacterized protein [Penaeus vannamei]|uniref:uncharacterized protein isoform X1 n=1 Tax=Penaeus vannamei TaxID=6689 RepID=UPI00387F8A97
MSEDMQIASLMMENELTMGDGLIETHVFDPVKDSRQDTVVYISQPNDQEATTSSFCSEPMPRLMVCSVPAPSPSTTSDQTSQEPHAVPRFPTSPCTTPSPTPGPSSRRPASRSGKRKFSEEFEACRTRQDEYHVARLQQLKEMHEAHVKEHHERMENEKLKKKLEELKIKEQELKVQEMEMKIQEQRRKVEEQEKRMRVFAVAEEAATLFLQRMSRSFNKLNTFLDKATSAYEAN